MRNPTPRLFIGTAGWSIRREQSDQFPAGPSVLARYAGRFNSAEINTSFYRPHRRSTYERWAATVPDEFRFSVKIPRAITHERRLRDCDESLYALIEQAAGLGDKLGCWLVQLPPSLKLDPDVAADFFETFTQRSTVPIVCEPRHSSWFTDDAAQLLGSVRVSRVAADPAPVSQADEPAGSIDVAYFRWHGSPKTYYSSYSDETLNRFAARIQRATKRSIVWCIFDNTAEGAAVWNALAFQERSNDRESV